MDGNQVVLDISSDEDVGFNWAGSDGCGKDIDWSELFVSLEADAGKNQNCDKGYDSDDVVVVGEVLAKPKRVKKSSGAAKLAAQHQVKDDDCVVLDGDPDKPAVEDKDSGGESDDLVIVAEKGQVACRDYPHPRHLCVKFSFDSTLHSDHCSLCHCYVCDSPAPCGKWGNGQSKVDHCHATEKEELWKSERKRAKQALSDPVVSTAFTPFWRDLPNQIPEPAPPLAQNSVSQSYFPGQAPSYNPPNIIRSERTGGVLVRNRHRSNRPSQQPINPCSKNFERTRVSSLNPHSVTSSPISKRSRLFGRVSDASARLPSRQARGNSSLDNFRHAYSNHLMDTILASKQADMGHLHTGYHQNSSAVNASQTSTVPIPSQGQVQLYNQATACANSNTYVRTDGNQNGNVSASKSLNAQSNASQNGQCFTGFSHLPGGDQLPLPEEQSSYGETPDFGNLQLDTQFLNELSGLDAEDGIHVDCLWQLF